MPTPRRILPAALFRDYRRGLSLKEVSKKYNVPYATLHGIFNRDNPSAMRRRKTLTPEDKRKILRLANVRGKTPVSTIARNFNLKKSAVNMFLTRHGTNVSFGPDYKPRGSLIGAYMEEGGSLSALSRRLGGGNNSALKRELIGESRDTGIKIRFRKSNISKHAPGTPLQKKKKT